MRTFLISCLALLLAGNTLAQKDSLDNKFYFRFGYSNPSWEQFGATKKDWGENAGKIGYMGEIGTIFMFKKLRMPDRMALGIDIDYGCFYRNAFSLPDVDEQEVDVISMRIDSKIGPSFTYSPGGQFAFDVYVKADMNWATTTTLVYDGDTGDADWYLGITTIGLSTGINLRWRIVMLGFEYNTVSPELENVDIEGDYLSGPGNSTSKKNKLPCTNFTIGLVF